MVSPDKFGDMLSIDKAIEIVLQNNKRLLAAKYMEKSAFTKIGTESAWEDPMLMLGVANLPTSFNFKEDMMTMRMIGISQSIPYAGQVRYLGRAARAEAEAAEQEYMATRQELIRATRYAFYDLYYQQQILKESHNLKSMAANIVAATMAQLQSNRANQADVAAAQADMWRVDTEILSATQAAETSRRTLSSLMGISTGDSITLAEPEIPRLLQSMEEMYKAALVNYPPLQKIRKQAESYAFSETAAKRMRWPMLWLSVEYDLRYDSEMEKRDNMVGFKASISLPFFSGWQQKNMATSMGQMKSGVEAEISQMEIDIRNTLETSSGKIARLDESLKLYIDRIIPAGEQAFKSALASFMANQMGFAPVQSYAQNLYRDKIVAIQISNERAKATADLQSYIDLSGDSDFSSISK
jgi:outer membrane protein TolC